MTGFCFEWNEAESIENKAFTLNETGNVKKDLYFEWNGARSSKKVFNLNEMELEVVIKAFILNNTAERRKNAFISEEFYLKGVGVFILNEMYLKVVLRKILLGNLAESKKGFYFEWNKAEISKKKAFYF